MKLLGEKWHQFTSNSHLFSTDYFYYRNNIQVGWDCLISYQRMSRSSLSFSTHTFQVCSNPDLLQDQESTFIVPLHTEYPVFIGPIHVAIYPVWATTMSLWELFLSFIAPSRSLQACRACYFFISSCLRLYIIMCVFHTILARQIAKHSALALNAVFSRPADSRKYIACQVSPI